MYIVSGVHYSCKLIRKTENDTLEAYELQAREGAFVYISDVLGKVY